MSAAAYGMQHCSRLQNPFQCLERRAGPAAHCMDGRESGSLAASRSDWHITYLQHRRCRGCAAGLLEYLANETPTSADAARDPGPDRYEPPEEGVLLQRGLIEPVSLEARLCSRPLRDCVDVCTAAAARPHRDRVPGGAPLLAPPACSAGDPAGRGSVPPAGGLHVAALLDLLLREQSACNLWLQQRRSISSLRCAWRIAGYLA